MSERDDYDEFNPPPDRWPSLIQWAIIFGGTVLAVGLSVGGAQLLMVLFR
jgi:hypothetical protein